MHHKDELLRLNTVLTPGAGLLSEKDLNKAVVDIAGSTGGLLHKAWRGGVDTMGIDFEQFFKWYRFYPPN